MGYSGGRECGVTRSGDEALLVTGYKGGKMGDMNIESHRTGVSYVNGL